MKFIQKNKFILHHVHEHVLIPYFEETDLKSQLKMLPLDESSIEEIAKNPKESLQQIIFNSSNCTSLSIAFMNLGCEGNFSLDHTMKLFRSFGKNADTDYQILLDGLQFKKCSLQQIIETIIKAMLFGAYSFSKENLKKITMDHIFSMRDELKDEKDDLTFTLISGKDIEDSMERAVNYGRCINYARMLGDIPGNYLHVKQFAQYCADMANEYNLTCQILGEEDLKSLHSGGILGVNSGSSEEANLITVYYEGSKGAPITALVGKGVMFDSGGYHLKGIDEMKGMKYDMCGAADVISALEIAVRQKSRKNILAVIPAVMNIIGPSACMMGDVLTTMSGKTVEVYNTDAEGRLILCDAITYAIKKGADSIIDFATLTNSCQKALGNEISGIFSNDDEYFKSFLKYTELQCEKVWRLPLDEVYHKPLYCTQAADLINYAPKRGGGASIAACFLEEFVGKDIPWIHLDIVGTAVQMESSKMQCIGATGALIASVSAFLE